MGQPELLSVPAIFHIAPSLMARAHGSCNVMAPPAQAGEIGRFAVVQDPQGGVFTVMQFSGPVDPPLGAEAENWSLEIGNPTSDF